MASGSTRRPCARRCRCRARRRRWTGSGRRVRLKTSRASSRHCPRADVVVELSYEIAVFACVGFFTLRRRIDPVREATSHCRRSLLRGAGAARLGRRAAPCDRASASVDGVCGVRMAGRPRRSRRAVCARAFRRDTDGCGHVGPDPLSGGGLGRGICGTGESIGFRCGVLGVAREPRGPGQTVAAQKLRVAYYAKGRFTSCRPETKRRFARRCSTRTWRGSSSTKGDSANTGA